MSMKNDFKMKSALRCMAQGGHVRGPGGPMDDKVPAMLSDGEYVLPAATVQAVGGPARLDALRNETAPRPGQSAPHTKHGLRMLAGGGFINPDNTQAALDAQRVMAAQRAAVVAARPALPTVRDTAMFANDNARAAQATSALNGAGIPRSATAAGQAAASAAPRGPFAPIPTAATPVADALNGSKNLLSRGYNAAKSALPSVGSKLRVAGNVAGAAGGAYDAYQGAKEGDTLKTTAGLALGLQSLGATGALGSTAAAAAAVPAAALIGAGSAGYLAGGHISDAISQNNYGLSNKIGSGLNSALRFVSGGHMGIDGDAADASLAKFERNAGTAPAASPAAAAAANTPATPEQAAAQQQAAAQDAGSLRNDLNQVGYRYQADKMQAAQKPIVPGQGYQGINPVVNNQQIDAGGLRDGGQYDSARPGDVIGTFNGRNITKAESEVRGGGLSSVGDRQGGGLVGAQSALRQALADEAGGPRSDSRAINQRFDKLAQEVNTAHQGRAGVNARLEQLQSVEDARARALGVDNGQGVDARGQDITAATARRGQDAASEDNAGRIQASKQIADAKNKQDAFALKQKEGEDNYKKYRELTSGLFRKQDGAGKDVEDIEKSHTFMSEFLQNTGKQIDEVTPADLLNAKQRFDQSKAFDAASGTTSSTWRDPTETKDISLGDVAAYPGVGIGDWVRNKIPIGQGNSLLTDQDGRAMVKQGDTDIDQRMRLRGQK